MLVTLRRQLRETRRENEALLAELNRAKANLDYVVMMTGAEVDEPKQTEEV